VGIGRDNDKNKSKVTETVLQVGHFTSDLYYPVKFSVIIDLFLASCAFQ
jgi:hypothetical protein